MEPTLAGAIIGHMVGDYVLQNDWMATNKSRTDTEDDWIVCAIHAAIWLACVEFFGGLSQFPNTPHPLEWALACLWLFGTHYLIDRYRLAARSMQYTGQATFAESLGPWSRIIVDNTWHLVTIWLLFWWWS
jgi:hypothetical protein